MNLDANVTELVLGPSLSFIEDSENLSFEQVSAPSSSIVFSKNKTQILNLGMKQPPVWIKLLLQDVGGGAGDWLLELSYPQLDEIEVYISNSDGSFKRFVAGDKLPFSKRERYHRNFIFPLKLSSSERKSIFIRVETDTSMQVPLTLWRPESFNRFDSLSQIMLGLFYGMMFVMVAYNFFIFLVVKDVAYIYYIGYILFFTVTQLTINGLGFQLLWPDSPWWANHGLSVLSNISMIFAVQFCRSFLSTAKTVPKLDRLMRWLAIFIAAHLPLAFIVHQAYSIVMTATFSVFIVTIFLSAGILRWKDSDRRARFFLGAWAFLLIGVLLKVAGTLGLMPSSFFTFYGVQVGSVIEVVLLSLALADRINTERDEKLAATRRSLNDYAERHAAEQKLLENSLSDPLTGLPNRAQLKLRVDETLQKIKHGPSHLILVQVHLLGFREINHTLGHHYGDQVLKEVSVRLDEIASGLSHIVHFDRVSQRHSHIAVVAGIRYAMVFELESSTLPDQILRDLTQRLTEPLEYQGMSLDIRVHMGLASYPQDGNDLETLLRHAQIAEETAERSGQPSAYYSRESDPYSQRRLTLMGELRQAIGLPELQMYFQPKISVANGALTLVGAEALIRWNHPIHGFISPDEFIPVAEQTGVINELTDWVINSAMTHCREFQKKRPDFKVAINISARNLLDNHLVNYVNTCLQEHDLKAESVILEITENVMMEETTRSIDILHQLVDLGVAISMDDFGTGYSSLSYLTQFPISEIKIDRSFIMNMKKSKNDRTIVETIIGMNKSLQLPVVAEGVEDQETLDSLRVMGCDIVQGYLIAKPMPGDQFLVWIESH